MGEYVMFRPLPTKWPMVVPFFVLYSVAHVSKIRVVQWENKEIILSWTHLK